MNQTFQTITRKCEFDSAHRVMNEKMKCFNLHGHRYVCELTFSFNQMENIGYPIDFKEIKRVGCQWIDDVLDHGVILNPEDKVILKSSKEVQSKIWLMRLAGNEYCNPTVENIAKEIFLAMVVLFQNYQHLIISEIKLYETPNCYTVVTQKSISSDEESNWLRHNYGFINDYRITKGKLNYDDREKTN